MCGKKVNVLVFTNMYPYKDYPFFGIFVKDEVESLRDEGVNVDVLFLNGRQNKLNYLTGIVKFLGKCRYSKYHLIHVHHTFCAYIAKLQRRTPVVFTLHEGEALFQPKSRFKAAFTNWRSIVKPKKIIKWICNHVEKVIVVAPQFKEELSLKTAAVIPCGIDLELFHPIPRDIARNRLNLPKDSKLVLFPANPNRAEKRFDIAKQTVEILKKEMGKVELLPLVSIPHDRVPLYMNACDAMLFVSDYEASPMVVKEAMACNLPIVSVAVGDVKEIIGKTKGCYICERSPEKLALKLREILITQERSEGEKKARELGKRAVARKVISVYKEVLSKKGDSFRK